MAHSKLAATRAAILSLALLLAGCGGGGSDSDEGKFSVGGTLSGLATGATIVLRLNNGLDLVLGANGKRRHDQGAEQNKRDQRALHHQLAISNKGFFYDPNSNSGGVTSDKASCGCKAR